LLLKHPQNRSSWLESLRRRRSKLRQRLELHRRRQRLQPT
jgi:hypothetical protein